MKSMNVPNIRTAKGNPDSRNMINTATIVSHVWVNEGYKKTVEETYRTGIVGYVHKEIPELGHKGNYLYSFAQGYLLSQAEPGFHCPVTLTQATAYLLDHYANDEVKENVLAACLCNG